MLIVRLFHFIQGFSFRNNCLGVCFYGLVLSFWGLWWGLMFVFWISKINQSINANHRLVSSIVSNPKPWIVTLRKKKVHHLSFFLRYVCHCSSYVPFLMGSINANLRVKAMTLRLRCDGLRFWFRIWKIYFWKPSIESLRNQIILFYPIPFSSSIAINFNNRYGKKFKSIVGWGNKWIN